MEPSERAAAEFPGPLGTAPVPQFLLGAFPLGNVTNKGDEPSCAMQLHIVEGNFNEHFTFVFAAPNRFDHSPFRTHGSRA